MTTIDGGLDAAGPRSGEPAVAVRLVTTYGDTTRRTDIVIGAETSTAVEDGVATSFPTSRLWPEVRDRLPDLAHLRSDPHGRPAPPRRAADPGFAEACEASVVLATLLTHPAAGDDGVVAVRTWLATADELWSATPQPDGSTDLRPAAEGAIGDLLIWDVTGAFEALVQQAGR